jgi:hypothetical protein
VCAEQITKLEFSAEAATIFTNRSPNVAQQYHDFDLASLPALLQRKTSLKDVDALNEGQTWSRAPLKAHELRLHHGSSINSVTGVHRDNNASSNF